MSRSAASSRLLLLLALAAPLAAEEGEEGRPVLAVPEGAAPVVDGKVGEEEWADAAAFPVTHGDERLGRAYLRRHARDLYVAYVSELPAFGTSLSATVLDPATQRRVILTLAPLSPPLPPLLLYRVRADGGVEPGSSAPCALRLDLTAPEGYALELRVPLAELEIGRTAKDYAFSFQVWALEEGRALGAFPEEARQGGGGAVLRGRGDWGADAEAAAHEPNEALALLADLWRESQWRPSGRAGPAPVPVLAPYLGVDDGKRREAPLRELHDRLARLAAAHPDYVSLEAQRMRTLVGLNDLEGALAALEKLAAPHPQLARSPQHLMLRVRTLRDLGRCDDALAIAGEHEKTLRAMPEFADVRTGLLSLKDLAAAEAAYREAEAKRDDLPRVRFETSKGEILFELFEDDAPNAVANFVALASEGAYDGTRFHWVEGGGHVIGGDPNSKNSEPSDDGFGGPGYTIETEVSRRAHLPYTLGFVDKVRSRHTEGSAFVIAIAPMPVLDGSNTVLGRVLEGHDVVRRLEYYDTLTRAVVVRKRPHPYQPTRR